MVHVETAIVATKTVTLVLGGLITYFSLKAYRRTGSTALRSLSIGFGIITFGAVLAGAIDVLPDIPPFAGIVPDMGLLTGVLVHSILTTVGFMFITYSLYED
jgi:hypothetical protein